MPVTADFLDFFTLLPSTARTFSKKTLTTKNLQKTCVFTGFWHIRVCAHASKIIWNCFERPSRASHATENSRKTICSSFRTPKWSPKSLWITSGSLLGLLRDPPGRQLDPLGAPLGPPWELRRRSRALLARSWRRFFSQLLETSPAGSDFARFGLHSGRETCKIQPETCEILAKT